MPPILTVRQLSACRGLRQVLTAIDLEILPGARILVTGENGSGKSTLLEAVIGLIPRISDCHRWIGRDGSPYSRGALRTGELVYLPQHRGLFESLTLRDNILLGAASRKDGVQRLRTVARSFRDLADALNRRPSAASAGQRQLASCLRAAMRSPRVLVLDEPTAGISDGLIPDLYTLFEHAISAEGAVLFTDQHLAYAQNWSTRVLGISSGKLVGCATRSNSS